MRCSDHRSSPPATLNPTGGGGDPMSLADGPQFAGVHARTADAFAPSDERRGAYLDLLVKLGGKCRGCGAGVNDAHLELHPGVCATCFRIKKLRPDPALLEKLAQTSAPPPPPEPPPVKTFAPAPPATTPAHVAPASPAAPTETRMACPECKNPGRHKADCSKNPEKKPAAPPAAKPPSKPAAAKPRVVAPRPAGREAALDVNLEALDGPGLRTLLAALRKRTEEVQAAIRARAEKLEAERKALLEDLDNAA
jgi:hypothetical protein